jgi:hypothetical protein
MNDETKRTSEMAAGNAEDGGAPASPKRREAMKKMGKYAAYVAPAMIVVMNSAEAAVSA